ncbi:MAG: hypothetical protein K2K17_11650 [Lachnospiraceae bacterium]|nr:hypothetical protein [Lachnospiraceae bacterium]
MKLKRVIALFAAAAVIAGSTISVSAAEPISGDYLTALIESGNAGLILNVDAYRAAYSDLDAAFGDNTNAYIEHYLTMGIYEGRTSGALFNPLAYAEAYSDVKAAFGDQTEALIDHYINFGISENRTEGTAQGYADIAEAQMIASSNGSNGSPTVNTRPNTYISNGASSSNSSSSSSYNSNTGSNSINDNTVISSINGNSGGGSINSDFAAVSAPTAGDSGNVAISNPAVGNSGNVAISNPATGNSGNVAVSTPATGDSANAAVSTPATGDSANVAVSTPASEDSGSATAPAPTVNNTPNNGNNYHHTTSIYESDGTLIRVEYYDENNRLFEYSDVINYDKTTNSYTENIFDVSNTTDTPDRTNNYVGGVLVPAD